MDHGHSHGVLVPVPVEECHTQEVDILENIQTILYSVSPGTAHQL